MVVSYTDELRVQWIQIGIIGLVSASLSLVGSASILVFIIWKKLQNFQQNLPLFHLSLADFILSLLWIISNVKYFVGSEHQEFSCFILLLLTEMIHLVTFFLTINYSVNVYFRMKDRTIQVHMITDGDELPPSNVRKWFKRSLYIVSWTLPMLMMIPIIVNIKPDHANACQRCVILIDVPVHKAVYGDIILALSLTISILAIILLYCLTLRLYWKAVPGFHTQHERRQLANMQARVTLYVSVFIICWSPGMMISYDLWFNHSHYLSRQFLASFQKFFPIFVLQATCAPLQGLLNSIVYGWTRKTFRSPPLPPPLPPPLDSLASPYYDFVSSVSA